MADPCTTCSDYEPLMPSEVCRTCARRLARRVAKLEGLIVSGASDSLPASTALLAERDRIIARRQREKRRRG